jgi:alpha-tubulin suppressor-like RCC1 family protein
VGCFGANSNGELGAGADSASFEPRWPEAIGEVTQVSAGDAHVCVTTRSGEAWCWGANHSGELGRTADEPRGAPAVVSGVDDVVRVSAGGSHSCALRRGGRVWCWGRLGDRDRRSPQEVAGLEAIRDIASGHSFMCGVTADRSVRCVGLQTPWGDREFDVGSGAAVAVTGVTAITAGDLHACAVTDGGEVLCWGVNDEGQLASDEWRRTHDAPPVRVADIEPCVGVAAGGRHTCAWNAEGRIWCWGANTNGQLGRGPSSPSNRPKVVTTLSNVTQAAAGGFAPDGHTCALLRNGSVWCWGANNYGQLGVRPLEARDSRAEPVRVRGLP